MSSAIEAAAAFLRNAKTVDPTHRTADLPEELRPHTVQDGYAVQDCQIGDTAIAGWKILATSDPSTYSCAAISAERVIADNGSRPQNDAHMEIEVEIAIRIGRDLPSQDAPFTEDDVNDVLDTAHAAFEIVESRFAQRKAVSSLTALADFQSNYAIVIGSGIGVWRGLDLPALEIGLLLDGNVVEKSKKGASVAQIVSAITWLANHAATRASGGLKAGQFVITGARIGPSPMPSAGKMVAEVEKIGSVTMRTATEG